MRGTSESGAPVAKGDVTNRYNRYSPGLDELTGLGPEAERDGAIIALSIKCGWSPSRLSPLFGISEKHVYRIVAEFRSEYGGGD